MVSTGLAWRYQHLFTSVRPSSHQLAQIRTSILPRNLDALTDWLTKLDVIRALGFHSQDLHLTLKVRFTRSAVAILKVGKTVQSEAVKLNAGTFAACGVTSVLILVRGRKYPHKKIERQEEKFRYLPEYFF